MTGGIEFDFSEFGKLTATFLEAPAKLPKLVAKAVTVTARHIKDDWREDAIRKNPNTIYYGYAIDYDLKLDVDGQIGAEIGPQLGAQGSLGILEDAPGNVRSTPQHSGRDALKKSEADFERGLQIAGEDALK